MPGLSDMERPLNERGKKDAPEMAKRLLQKNIHPDLLVTSTATRARNTCLAFAAILEIEKENIIESAGLYMAGIDAFLEVIASLPDNAQCVALFSHNPGITEFANTLTHARIDHLPTCAVFGATASCAHWTDFAKQEKAFWLFDWPKNLDRNIAG